MVHSNITQILIQFPDTWRSMAIILLICYLFRSINTLRYQGDSFFFFCISVYFGVTTNGHNLTLATHANAIIWFLFCFCVSFSVSKYCFPFKLHRHRIEWRGVFRANWNDSDTADASINYVARKRLFSTWLRHIDTGMNYRTVFVVGIDSG